MNTPITIPNTGSNPFKQLAHELIDRLPRDATWQDLLAEVQFQIDVEEAAPVPATDSRSFGPTPAPHTDRKGQE